MLACPREGRESISNRYFLVVVPQPISFCILKKRADHSAWFTFSRVIPHFLSRYFLAKCSFHSSVCFQCSCRSRRLMKKGPSATSRKIWKLTQQAFWEEYQTNIHVLWNFHLEYTIIQRFMLFSILNHSCKHVWRCGCVFCSLIRTCASRLKSICSTYVCWRVSSSDSDRTESCFSQDHSDLASLF